MKIVELTNGKFAIMRFNLFFTRHYVDKTNSEFSWGIKSKYFKDCQFDSLEDCELYLKESFPKVKRIVK